MQVSGKPWGKFTPGQFDAGRELGVECRGLVVVFIMLSMLYCGVDEWSLPDESYGFFAL